MREMLNGDMTVRFGDADYLMVFRNLPHGMPEDKFYLTFPARPDAIENMKQAWGFVVYRHIIERSIGRPGANIPIPIPDITGG
jgi:hypothetical protein